MSFMRSRVSSVCIMSILRTLQPDVWIPLRAGDIAFLQNFHTGSDGPTSLASKYRLFFPLPRNTGDHLTPSIGEVKNEWNNCTTPLLLFELDRDNFNIQFLFLNTTHRKFYVLKSLDRFLCTSTASHSITDINRVLWFSDVGYNKQSKHVEA